MAGYVHRLFRLMANIYSRRQNLVTVFGSFHCYLMSILRHLI